MNYFLDEVEIEYEAFDYLFDGYNEEDLAEQIKKVEKDLDGSTLAYDFANNYIMGSTVKDICDFIIYQCGENSNLGDMPLFNRDYLEGNTIEAMAEELEYAFKEVYQANRERWLEEVKKDFN